MAFVSIPESAIAFSNSEVATGDSRVVASAFEDQSRQASCSGALVEPRIVMLAGHCTARKLNGTVVFPNLQGQPFSGEIPLDFNWVVYAPGAKVTTDGNKEKARVIAQFLAPEFSDGKNGRGPVCDFAVLVLSQPLSDKYFTLLDNQSLTRLREQGAETVSLGYGYKSFIDLTNSMTSAGRDPNPVSTKSNFRVGNLSDGSENFEICEGSTNNNLSVHVKLPSGVFVGSSDSGGPLWLKQNEKWVYVGAVSGSVGLGINNSTPENSSLWKDANAIMNSGVNYVTAQAFEKTIARAKNYLETIQVAEAAADKAEADKAAELVAQQIAAAAKSAQVEKTITCTKGKVTKKVSAVNPECPAGYKKKSNTCRAAFGGYLKLVNQGMINSKYRVKSGFMVDRYDFDGPMSQIRNEHKVLAANIQGIGGDSVIAMWGIEAIDNDVRIFALNKQTKKYSIDLAYLAGSDRGKKFTVSPEVKADALQLSVDKKLISCF